MLDFPLPALARVAFQRGLPRIPCPTWTLVLPLLRMPQALMMAVHVAFSGGPVATFTVIFLDTVGNYYNASRRLSGGDVVACRQCITDWLDMARPRIVDTAERGLP